MYGTNYTDPYQALGGGEGIGETVELAQEYGVEITPVQYMYPYEREFTANELAQNQRVNIDGDADFAISAITRDRDGLFEWRLADSRGNYLMGGGPGGTRGFVRDVCCMGTGSLPFLVRPRIIIPKAGSLVFDIRELSGASNTIHIAFIGHKLFSAAVRR